MMTVLAALAASLFATSAQPTKAAGTYQDGAGLSWRAIPARNGVVLASRLTNIHLGADCKAGSPRYGTGRWEWANGGFTVIFGETRIAFPRQEIDAGQGQNCRA